MALALCVSTVLMLILRRDATSLVRNPSATNRSTSSSRLLSLRAPECSSLRAGSETANDLFGDGWIEVGMAGAHAPDRPDEFFRGALLQEISARARSEQLLNIAAVGVARENQYFRGRDLRLQHLRRGQAVHPRHRDVHDDHVGAELPDHVDCRETVAGLADDLQIIFAIEHHAQAFAHDLVIVDENDAQFGHSLPRSGITSTSESTSASGSPQDIRSRFRNRTKSVRQAGRRAAGNEGPTGMKSQDSGKHEAGSGFSASLGPGPQELAAGHVRSYGRVVLGALHSVAGCSARVRTVLSLSPLFPLFRLRAI